MGFHGYAFDQATPVDEELHWHEFESISWVISGTGRFADEHGNVFDVAPGCRLKAPAGWLHRNLAGPAVRIVIGTNLPFEQWSKPRSYRASRITGGLSLRAVERPFEWF